MQITVTMDETDITDEYGAQRLRSEPAWDELTEEQRYDFLAKLEAKVIERVTENFGEDVQQALSEMDLEVVREEEAVA